MLLPDQIQELLSIIDRNHNIYFISQFGPDFLTDADKEELERYGVNVDELYTPENDLIFTQFHFGILAQSLQNQTKQITFSDLKQYITKGQYIPVTARETAQLNSIRNQSLNDIRGLKGKIFQDVNQIILNNTKKNQEQFLKDRIEEGFLNKESVEEISRDISIKTGDWSRDFDRIVQYVSETAYQEGKVAHILKYSGEDDPLVYKTVFDGACRHCIRLYLTSGLGSEPKIFKLSELRQNGTNIGRKVDDWLPIIGPTHPYCRCPLNDYVKGSIWDVGQRRFIIQSLLTNRKKVKIRVGNKEFYG